jgi:flagellar motor switch protein FliG
MSAESEKLSDKPEGSSLTPAQRAAVIISLLDESLVKRMLSRVDGTELERIEAVMASVPRVPKQELNAIVAGFLNELHDMVGGIPSGPLMLEDFRQSILADLRAEADGLANSRSTDSMSSKAPVWVRLQGLDPARVAEYLSVLPSNLVAAALRRVEPGFSAQLIAHLEEARSGPAMAELLAHMKSDPEIDLLIERMVEEDLLDRSGDEDESAKEDEIGRIGEVMSLLPATKRERMIEFLKERHPDQLDVVQRQVLDIANLPDLLPVKYVPLVTREFDDGEFLRMLAVFRDAYTGVFEFLIGNISSRMADNLRSELEGCADVGAEEADQLVNTFTKRLLDLRRDKVIEFSK